MFRFLALRTAGAALGLLPVSASAQLIEAAWNAASDGNWTDITRWDRIAPPPAGPLGTFPNGPNYAATVNAFDRPFTVNLDVPIELPSLTIGDRATVQGSNSLLLDRLAMTGTISQAAVTINQSLDATRRNWARFVNTAVTISGTASNWVGSLGTTTFTIQPGRQLELQNAFLWGLNDQVVGPPNAQLFNSGIITGAGTYNSITLPILNDASGSAQIRAASGDVDLWGAVSGPATYHVSAGRTLTFTSGDLPIDSSVSGDGDVRFLTGNIRIAGDYSPTGKTIFGDYSAPRVTFDRSETTLTAMEVQYSEPTIATAGLLHISGQLTVHNSPNELATTFSGGGTTIVDGGGVIHGHPMFDGHTLRNRSAMTLNRVRMYALAPSELINEAGATMDFKGVSEARVEAVGAAGTISNLGLMRIPDSDYFESYWTLRNDGTLIVGKDALAEFANIGAGSGAYIVRAGGRLSLKNSTSQVQSFGIRSLIVEPGATFAVGWITPPGSGPVIIDGDINIDGELDINNAALLGRVSASSIRANLVYISPTTFFGSLNTTTLTAGSNIRFAGQENFVTNLVGGNLTVDHDLTVTGNCSGARIGGDGITRLNALSGEIQKYGNGTLFINGPVSFTINSSILAYGGTVVLDSDIGSPNRRSTLLAQNATAILHASQHLGSVRTSNTGAIVVAPAGDTFVRINMQSSISQQFAQGLFDVTDNSVIFDYVTDSPFDLVFSQIFRGYSAGQWLSRGLTSSTAAADERLAIGYGEAARLFGPAGGTFFGAPVDDTTVLARLTFAGDANLDGDVDIDDFAQLSAAFGGGGLWEHGDFNYDQETNIADFAHLAANFNFAMSPAPARSAVPEPTAGALLAVGSLLIRRCGHTSR